MSDCEKENGSHWKIYSTLYNRSSEEGFCSKSGSVIYNGNPWRVDGLKNAIFLSKSENEQRAVLLRAIAASDGSDDSLRIEFAKLKVRLKIESQSMVPDSPRVSPRIERPPGHRFIAVLQAFFPKSHVQRVWGQIVADSREEYYEALAEGDYVEAERIKRKLNLDLVLSIVEYVSGLPAHLIAMPFKLFDKDK